jgi:hypothetical protein
MVAEMTDETNIAQIFSYIPLAWAIGAAARCVNSSLIDWLRDKRHVRRPTRAVSFHGAGQIFSATRSGYCILTFFHVLQQVYTDLSRVAFVFLKEVDARRWIPRVRWTHATTSTDATQEFTRAVRLARRAKF